MKNIYQPLFINETGSVYCEVGSGLLYAIQMSASFLSAKQVTTINCMGKDIFTICYGVDLLWHFDTVSSSQLFAKYFGPLLPSDTKT